jgi:catechol 2,3-dioxygenase-like lactoylglutathione lyase family enzyme
MRMTVSSLLVDDQQRALALYTGPLGLLKKNDIPLGTHSWLTVVSPEDPDGHELLLEPDEHPAAKAFKAALMEDGIPVYSLTCDDVTTEHERLVAAGLRFTQPPVVMGPVTTAVFDDTCGNLIQIASLNG